MWAGNFKSALSSLRQAKWRSVFTMLGIIIGISSVVTIVSLGEGLKQQIVGQVTDLGSNVVTVRPGKVISNNQSINFLSLLSASDLTAKDVDTLQKLPSVSEVVPISFVTSSVKGENGQLDNVFVAGTTSEFSNIVKQGIDFGEFLPAGDEDQIAIIGPTIARQLYGDTNVVGHQITIAGQSFIIHGVFQKTTNSFLSVAQADLNSSVLIPFSQAPLLTGGNTNILQIFVKSSNPNDVNQAIAQINSALVKNHGQQDFSVLKQKQLLDITSRLVNTATGYITGLAAISLLVGGIGIMDIMLVSVSERNREIGIRKAVGATNRQILNQFLTEGLTITIAGGIIGIIFSLIINEFLRLYTNWKPVINIYVLVIAVVFSVVVGIIFSTAPAIKASRKDPITALRGD